MEIRKLANTIDIEGLFCMTVLKLDSCSLCWCYTKINFGCTLLSCLYYCLPDNVSSEGKFFVDSTSLIFSNLWSNFSAINLGDYLKMIFKWVYQWKISNLDSFKFLCKIFQNKSVFCWMSHQSIIYRYINT